MPRHTPRERASATDAMLHAVMRRGAKDSAAPAALPIDTFMKSRRWRDAAMAPASAPLSRHDAPICRMLCPFQIMLHASMRYFQRFPMLFPPPPCRATLLFACFYSILPLLPLPPAAPRAPRAMPAKDAMPDARAAMRSALREARAAGGARRVTRERRRDASAAMLRAMRCRHHAARYVTSHACFARHSARYIRCQMEAVYRRRDAAFAMLPSPHAFSWRRRAATPRARHDEPPLLIAITGSKSTSIRAVYVGAKSMLMPFALRGVCASTD